MLLRLTDIVWTSHVVSDAGGSKCIPVGRAVHNAKHRNELNVFASTNVGEKSPLDHSFRMYTRESFITNGPDYDHESEGETLNFWTSVKKRDAMDKKEQMAVSELMVEKLIERLNAWGSSATARLSEGERQMRRLGKNH